jgi:hypothetical protein
MAGSLQEASLEWQRGVIMAEALIGRLDGKTITLEEAVPPLDGRRVRVLLEAVEDSEVRLSNDEQEELWKAWTERGPQGPIDETPAMELP